MTVWQPRNVPIPFDVEAGEALLAWLSTWLEETDRDIAVLDGSKADLIVGLGGCSPYLAKIIQRQPEIVLMVLQNGPDTAEKSIWQTVLAEIETATDSKHLMTALRNAKEKLHLLTALGDVAGDWSVMRVTRTLSRFAEVACQWALAHALAERVERGDLGRPTNWPDTDTPPKPHPNLTADCGYFLLALGKMGADELNYSSDIDLIALFDPTRATEPEKRSINEGMVRLTQDVIRILSQRTPAGYVFRVDLRLRPDPGATPLAVSILAAETYYQSIGQTWERAALIKAKPVAGDMVAANAFLDMIRPFVWRRNLDFSAIEDIHSMKQKLHAHYGHDEICVAGANVKLGYGGIREIEFLAQAEQLISGGRNPALRQPATLDALKAATALGRMRQNDCATLSDAYGTLRILEHRLQMINDEQTHSVPTDKAAALRLANFMGYPEMADMEAALRPMFQAVHGIYTHELVDSREADESAPRGDKLEAYLMERGYKDSNSSAEILERWRVGRYRAARSERARRLMEVFLPDLIEAFAGTTDPDRALARMDRFLAALPAGVQLFSLLQTNRWLFTLLAKVMGTAPLLADHIARRPAMIEAILSPDFFQAPPDRARMLTDMQTLFTEARDYQDVLDLSRRYVSDTKFQIGLLMLEGLMSVSAISRALCDLADAAILALLPHVEADFALRSGTLPGELAVIAMGSYGGGNMSYTSDLDIILLYDAPTESEAGTTSLSPSQYYSRLGSHLITALTAMTGEGRLYEVDMRLRPSGRKGPLVVTLETFREYQLGSAWTYEHMALTRARIVHASDRFSKEITGVIHDALTQPRKTAKLAKRVHEMRGKLDEQNHTENPWDTRDFRGGLVDVEFIVQFLLLRDGAKHPEMFSTDILESIRALRTQGSLSPEDAEALSEAYRIGQAVQGVLRFAVVSEPEDEMFTEELKSLMIRATEAMSFEGLSDGLAASHRAVQDLYERTIIAALPKD